MRRILLFVTFILSTQVLPAAGQGNYAIHLKDGGRLLTPHYWEEGQEIRFYTPNGIVGIEKLSVKKIEPTDEALPRVPPPSPMPVFDPEKTVTSDPAKTVTSDPAKTADDEEPDIEALRETKDRMITELDEIAERMREATRLRDTEKAAQYREEMRRKSAEIYEFTDEVIEKNRGNLPDGWWDRP